ncbi:hypothetical protein Tco_1536341 [Tanacetum coccineum]
MLASVLSPTDSTCSGGGGTDGGSDSESGLDLLQYEDGNSDESSGYQVDDGAALHRFMAALTARFPRDYATCTPITKCIYVSLTYCHIAHDDVQPETSQIRHGIHPLVQSVTPVRATHPDGDVNPK